MEERYLSLSAAKRALGISERTAYRWIKSGKLRAYKPGRDYRIPETAIRELMERSEAYPKNQAPLPFEEWAMPDMRRGSGLKEDAEQFIKDHEPLLRDEALTQVVSGKLAKRSAERMTKVRDQVNEANAAENYSLVELNNLIQARDRLIAFTKSVIENHERRFGVPYDPVEEANNALREAEKNHGTLA
jgi:excisionase family DNA binding protein